MPTCQLCNIETCRHDSFEGKLCMDCTKKHARQFWHCAKCRNLQKDFQEKTTVGICLKCIGEMSFSCYECNSVIPNPTRRNICSGRDGVCDKCLEDREEVSFGSPVVCAEFGKIGSRRYFGCELETSKSDYVIDVVRETQWGFYQDGSIDGLEFTSPPMCGDAGYEAIKKFCEIAHRHNFEVNRACGFHLHVCVSDLSPQKIQNMCLAYHYTYPVWKSMVAPSRHGNSYCGYNKEEYKYPLEPGHSERWRWHHKSYWICLENLNHYGTIEIRLHQGTLNPTKIINWVRMHTMFIDWTTKHSEKDINDMFATDWLADNRDGLLENMGAIWRSPRLIEYVKTRGEALCQ